MSIVERDWNKCNNCSFFLNRFIKVMSPLHKPNAYILKQKDVLSKQDWFRPVSRLLQELAFRPGFLFLWL